MKLWLSVFTWILAATSLYANWPSFRGADGTGSSKVKNTPLKWGDQEGIVWKTELPGPGASSPTVWGDRIFLTCSSGFGPGINGSIENLKRHVLCFDRKNGKLLWNTAIPAELPEQEKIREDHGYASSTPVVDEGRVIVFFGKTGVIAFDHHGKEIWRNIVGSRLNGWGSATSLALHNNLVLVNASVESGALVALDKNSGKEIWRANGVDESWHAPVVVPLSGGKVEVVTACIKQIHAFDFETGQKNWTCQTGIQWYMCPTPVTRDGVLYAIGGRNPQAGIAIKTGGKGDVTASHVLWKIGRGSNVPSPALDGDMLYFAHESLAVAYCANIKTGELHYEERLNMNPNAIYASPVVADGKVYYFGRTGQAVVIASGTKFERLTENSLENRRGVFNASPCFDENRILIRSNRYLYCLGTAR